MAREHRENQISQFEQLGTLLKGLEIKLEHMKATPLPPGEPPAASVVYKDFTSMSLLALNQIGTSISSIGNSFTQMKTTKNKHFDTPRPVDPFYTGREDQEEQLKSCFLPESSQTCGSVRGKTLEKQKRFVIYGVGGSGKTQFCCKFAEDNRDW
jgi:hypothetical protein